MTEGMLLLPAESILYMWDNSEWLWTIQKNLPVPPLPLPRDIKLPFHGREKGWRCQQGRSHPSQAQLPLTRSRFHGPAQEGTPVVGSAKLLPKSATQTGADLGKKDWTGRRGKENIAICSLIMGSYAQTHPGTDHIWHCPNLKLLQSKESRHEAVLV